MPNNNIKIFIHRTICLGEILCVFDMNTFLSDTGITWCYMQYKQSTWMYFLFPILSGNVLISSNIIVCSFDMFECWTLTLLHAMLIIVNYLSPWTQLQSTWIKIWIFSFEVELWCSCHFFFLSSGWVVTCYCGRTYNMPLFQSRELVKYCIRCFVNWSRVAIFNHKST